MVNYILRRVLFMIPTLLGITFLVFMMLALSPGGIGAALLSAGGGGAMQSSNDIAVQRAKLEDRYGLNEPAPVQYLRWLGRISPVKFGQRDLISPQGDLIVKPRPVPAPTAWTWFADELPPVARPTQAQIDARFPAGDDTARARAFRDAEREYSDARAASTTLDARVRNALKDYVEATKPSEQWTRYIDGEKPRVSRILAEAPVTNIPEYARLAELSAQAREAYARASAARELLVAGMATRPYPEAGFGISGVVSLAWPDLGTAFSRQRPVTTLIREHLPTTLLLNLIAIPIIYFIAVPSGMLAAVRKGTSVDVGLGVVYIALFSVPTVLAGTLALGFLATPDHLNAFPTSGLSSKAAEAMPYLPTTGELGSRGWLLDRLWHVVLPVTCLVYTGFAVLSKQTRAAMLENLNADYVRTAKAKGVPSGTVIFAHVFRNSLLPLITLFVTIFPGMLAGSVVIERIFSVQGMGFLLLDAITNRDRELILANTTIIAIVNLLALLLADILYAIADPRIAYK
jgi:ABC-type dipeptide/oligopeptide/nickel transport system permease component